MLTSELITLLMDEFSHLNLSERVMHEAAITIIKEIAINLQKKRGLEIRGFGSLQVNTFEPCERRNPKTGEIVKVGKRHRIIFKAAKKLRLVINY